EAKGLFDEENTPSAAPGQAPESTRSLPPVPPAPAPVAVPVPQVAREMELDPDDTIPDWVNKTGPLRPRQPTLPPPSAAPTATQSAPAVAAPAPAIPTEDVLFTAFHP